MKYWLYVSISFLFLLVSIPTRAQEAPDRYTPDSLFSSPMPPTADETKKAEQHMNSSDLELVAQTYNDPIRKAIDRYWKDRFMKSPEFLICVMLLIFATGLFVIYYRLFSKGILESYQIIKLNLITLIIIGTLFLIAAGYDKEQILSAMGLFGTIAGYLLGKSSPTPTQPTPSTPTPITPPETPQVNP